MRNMLNTLLLGLLLAAGFPALAQDPLDQIDLDSPAMSEAELTRQQVEALIEEARSAGNAVDLSRRHLSGLDLSGLDLRDANLRWARFNRSNLQGADLRGADLGLAWLIEADLRGADVHVHPPLPELL